jgi:DNA-binding LacI/PurR family transcriptional regulator
MSEAMPGEALLAINDLLAIGAISRFRVLGAGLPSDISVTGFDDIVIGRHVSPSLTTITTPRVELGRPTWSLLHATLEQRSTDSEPTLLPTSR